MNERSFFVFEISLALEMIKITLYGRYVDPVIAYFSNLTMALDWVNWMLIQRGANPMDFEQSVHINRIVDKLTQSTLAEFSLVEIKEV